MKLAVLFLVLVLGNCAGQKNGANGDPNSDVTSDSTVNVDPISNEDGNSNNKSAPKNDLTHVVSGAYSGIEIAETRVIKDFKSLEKFYSRINRTRKPGLPLPKVDFSKETIIVRCSGTINSGSTPQLYVQGETKDELIIGSRETQTDAGSSAVTTPFTVYRMPLTKKKVKVSE